MENITSIETEQKIEYVKSLGILIEDEYNGVINFELDYQYELDLENIEIGDSINEIIKASKMISCCGGYIDEDIMRCPICHEHC